MKIDSAHQSRWAIAEVVFGIPLLISIAIQWLVPFSISPSFPGQIRILVGLALIITGIAVIVLARRAFAQYAQPTDPGHPTSKIIQTGLFAVSRNPLYLGAVLFILGLGLALNNLWTLILLLVSIILAHTVLIFPEERYLAGKFGQEYQQYRSAVSRWFGRKSTR